MTDRICLAVHNILLVYTHHTLKKVFVNSHREYSEMRMKNLVQFYLQLLNFD